MAYLLFVSTHTPYHTSHAKDALEAALSASNVGLEIRFVFYGDGVYQLLETQSGDTIDHKSLLKQLSLMPLYDIENIYIALGNTINPEQYQKLAIDLESLGLRSLEDDGFADLVKNANNVLVF
ncbi:DsrE family protein [Agaribacter flavus]|uniref:DsrE family protein n=1 Tax=Agaribacter flavus TaxID=1902781 RepID=A0ABV7FTF9_9ALTE